MFRHVTIVSSSVVAGIGYDLHSALSGKCLQSFHIAPEIGSGAVYDGICAQGFYFFEVGQHLRHELLLIVARIKRHLTTKVGHYVLMRQAEAQLQRFDHSSYRKNFALPVLQ